MTSWKVSPKRYVVYRLVYYEQCGNIESVIASEKQIKKRENTLEIRFDRENESGPERSVR